MKIKWLAHSCFLFTTSDDRTLLTDPFDESVGYPVPKVVPLVCTCSHDHFDHHFTKYMTQGCTIIDTPGEHHSHGFVVKGVKSFHDDRHGSLRGKNIINVFEADGLRVAHMGDLGHLPTPAMAEELKDIDIMLLPVGGRFTIDGDQAAEVVDMLKPRVTIPMHFRMPGLTFELADASRFLSHYDYHALDTDEIEVTRRNLDDFAPVALMAFKS